MKTLIFGQTASGIPIIAHRFENDGPEILIIGGVHGDEVEGSICTHALLGAFIPQFPYKLNLTLIPTLNLDGLFAGKRVNGHGIDLNRNLPSNDWNPKAFNERYPPGPFACSEPENQALVAFLDKHKPSLIISIHSFTRYMINVNGNCSPEAEAMQAVNHYSIEETIGYPTPGSLGTYAGMERDMPTITYEIEKDTSTENILNIHVKAIQAALQIAQNRKLR